MKYQSGYSLIQLLVVAAIITVLAAVAAPGIYHALKYDQQDTAVRTMKVALEDAVSRARSGSTLTFSPMSVVGIPAGVEINSSKYPAPDGSTLAPEFELQGGRGTPLVREGKRETGARPAPVAVVLGDQESTWVTALVCSTSGIVTRYDRRDEQWIHD